MLLGIVINIRQASYSFNGKKLAVCGFATHNIILDEAWNRIEIDHL